MHIGIRTGILTLVAAAALAIGVLAGGSAEASGSIVSPQGGLAPGQQSAPANFYGKAGVSPGDRIEAFIAGRSCGAFTVNASNEWVIAVSLATVCAPTENAAVSFTVNGQAATATPAAVFKVGGTPPDISTGYALTKSGSAAPATPTAPAAPTAPGNLAISGGIPRSGGIGFVVFLSGGTVQQLVTATGCPAASMALYAPSGDGFVAYVPGTPITAVNQAFLDVYKGGNIAANTAFIGRCV